MAVKRKKQDKEALKCRIVEAASQAFTKQGVRSVHMDDLAISLSISKRTLYELFNDKEQLLLEVIRLHWQETNNYMLEIISGTENVLEIIFAFYKRKLNELGELNPQFFRDLRKYPEILNALHEEYRKNDAIAITWFQKGVEQGIFRGDINFDIISQAMSMQLDMIIYSDITENYPLAQIYSEVTILHMRGITTIKGQQMIDEFLKDI